jgi:lipopolysaccharide transport system permease protein
MARVALPAGWAGALTRQRGPLRTYQWLWLLLCTAGALVVAAPRILSQPVIYISGATVRIDVAQHYAHLYSDEKRDFQDAQNIAIELLQLDYPKLGTPTLGVQFTPHNDGSIDVLAVAGTAAEAQALADTAATALAQSVRAAGGREIFRQLMGWEQFAASKGAPPRDSFQQTLRQIWQTTAFSLNQPVDIVSEPFTVDQLQPEAVSDLARAFEVREVELSKIDLPALITQRDQALGDDKARLSRDVVRLTTGLEALRAAQAYLYTNLHARFDPDARSDAYRSARAALPDAPVDHHIPALLALAALVGLVFGGTGVAVDRAAGVMPKLRELWGYRELIRNLVLRDLRVRYKGSALGYLWTQLAPLLMMLVFWFVFSFFFRAGGAMFPVFLIVGLLPWNFCSEAVNNGTRSVLDNSNLIKKVFFPREVLPLVSVFSSLVNYILSLPMMFLLMAIVQWLYPPLGGHLNFSWTFAYLPVLLVIETLFLGGVVLFTSALAVFFRDFVHLIGILLQFWFFLTPVVYSLDNINIKVGGVALASIIRWLNPMASLVDFYHDILYGNAVGANQVPTPGLPALNSVLRVLVTALIMLAVGYWFFQRRSGRFGEEI